MSTPSVNYHAKLRWQNGRWVLFTIDGVEYRSLSEIPDPRVRQQIGPLMMSHWPKQPDKPPLWFLVIFLGLGIILLLLAGILGYQVGWIAGISAGLPGIVFATLGGMFLLQYQRKAPTIHEVAITFSIQNQEADPDAPPATAVLEERMRPGRYSSVGFLGWDESLETVIETDRQTLARLNLSYQQIADRLEAVLSAVWSQQAALHPHSEEYRRRSSIPTIVSSARQAIPLEQLPDSASGYLVDDHLQVFIVQYRGWQQCPWDCPGVGGSSDFWLLNRRTGALVSGPALIVHLISQHQFFEGLESSYRVDPIQLAKVLFPHHLTS